MALAKRTLEWEYPSFRARVTVATATTLMGLERSRLVDEGLSIEHNNPLVKAFCWLQWPIIKVGTASGWIEYIPEEEEPEEEPEDAGADPEQEQHSAEPEPGDWVRYEMEELTGAEGAEIFLEAVPELVSMNWLSTILDLNPHWMLRTRGDESGEALEKKRPRQRRKRS